MDGWMDRWMRGLFVEGRVGRVCLFDIDRLMAGKGKKGGVGILAWIIYILDLTGFLYG